MALRHRPTHWSHIRNPFSLLSRRERARTAVRAAADFVVEALEDRKLLTSITLHGGDTFVFINEDGVYQSVSASGNITAQVIGANVNGADQIVLEDLPGQLNGQDVNGGFTIPNAATPVGVINVTTPTGTLVIPPSSLAVDPATGILYGIAIQTIPQNNGTVPPTPATNDAYLVQLNKSAGGTGQVAGNVLAEISQPIISGAGLPPGTTAEVTGVQSAVFNPNNGLLYFAATAGAQTAGSTTTGGTQTLYTVNVNSGNIPASVSFVPGNFAGNVVSALTYDTQNQTLVAAAGKSIFNVNGVNSNNITGQVTATSAGPITGLAFAPSPSTGVRSLYAIDGSNVYTVDQATGAALDYGPLGITNPGDLTYDPTTGLAYTDDLSGNTLDTVSLVNRTRWLSVYQIYISQSDASGSITTQQSNAGGVPTNIYGAVAPQGIQGSLNVWNRIVGGVELIMAPNGSGDALVGARTRTVEPGLAGQADYQLYSGIVNTPLGVAPYAVGASITPGVVSAPGTTVGSIGVFGTLLGNVELNGNVDTFYTGWLLTGISAPNPPVGIGHFSFTPYGEPMLNRVDDPGNFSVSGDIRNLIVQTWIGTEADAETYLTGFDMHVAGTIGAVHAFDSIVGNINSAQSPTAQSLNTILSETELSGIVGGDPLLRNDTFATQQDVGSLPTTVNGLPSAVVLDGTLAADPINQDYADYYGIALLAGQTITCKVMQLIPPPLVLNLAVFNPDGTLTNSDYNTVDLGQTQQKFFRFTADRPGVYRFAVSETGDATFTDPSLNIGDIPYQMTVTGVGDLAIGAIVAATNVQGNVDPMHPEADFGTQVGDIGAITSGAASTAGEVDALTGSLRDVNAGSTKIITINIPLGNVGLVNTTTGNLLFNIGGTSAIGGDFQLLSSAADFQASLIADGSIGVLRAAMMTLGPSVFQVNAGNSTTPGNIDLIDVTGDLGSFQLGGPHIITGPLGNVGYIRVGGMTYRDSFFGGSQPEATLYQPGESVTLTDDSGAQVVITPTGTPLIAATGGPGSNDTSGTVVNPNLPQLTITAYGIEGSGGVAIENVTSTGGATLTGSGQQTGQTVQIGKINAEGLGQTINELVVSPGKVTTPSQPAAPVSNGIGGIATGGTGGVTTGGTTTAPTFYTGPDTAGPVGRTLFLPNPPILDPNSTTPLDVILNGSARMDAFEVDGGYVSSITDNTGGDIVNVNAISVGTLSSNGQIGLSQGHTGAALNGVSQVTNTFPLLNAHNGINVNTPFNSMLIGKDNPIVTTTVANGVTTTTTTAVVTTPAIVKTPMHGIVSLIAGNGLGNINAVGELPSNPASIGTIQGSILAPVFATGSVYSVVLGSKGIAPSGTGVGSQAGLYVNGQIGIVTNSAPADIRGTIASRTGITGINLKNGSIIFADIEETQTFAGTVQLPIGHSAGADPSPITNPVFDVGNIIVEGNGGIIGTVIGGDHIGHIDVHHGFGIFDDLFGTIGDGTIAGILADGYGIRGVTFLGGSSVGSIVATGDGRNISTQVYSSSVRYSESNAFDPFSSFQPNTLTDINVLTGATAQVPQLSPITGDPSSGTDSGVISTSQFVGNRDLGSVRAFQIRDGLFNFANSIGSITSRSNDNGLTVDTGRLKAFHPGGNIDNLTFQIAGPINSLVIGGNVSGTSTIAATGRNGNIGNLRVGGSLQGSITAARTIKTAVIGQNLTGTVSARQINSLRVGGQINGGNLAVEGNINTLTFLGDIGLPGESLTIHGSARTINIAGNLNVNLSVQGNLGTLHVAQSVLSGTLADITGVISLLRVDGDVQAGATLRAKTIKHERLGGQVLGTIIGA